LSRKDGDKKKPQGNPKIEMGFARTVINSQRDLAPIWGWFHVRGLERWAGEGRGDEPLILQPRDRKKKRPAKLLLLGEISRLNDNAVMKYKAEGKPKNRTRSQERSDPAFFSRSFFPLACSRNSIRPQKKELQLKDNPRTNPKVLIFLLNLPEARAPGGALSPGSILRGK
jgi:hypothetical protein